jgi:hypothetical protein
LKQNSKLGLQNKIFKTEKGLYWPFFYLRD